MAIPVDCPCGARLRIRDENANKWQSCPKCGLILNLPPEEGIRALDHSVTAKPSPLSEEAPDEITDVDPEALRPRTAKARKRYLRGVNVGLALHYVIPFLFLVGTGTGLIGMLVAMNGAIHDWEGTSNAAGFFFRTCGIFQFLVGSLALPVMLFGLFGSPDGAGRGQLLIGSGLLALGTAAAAVLALYPRFGTILFLVALAALFGAWVHWMVFLGRLGPILKRPEFAEGSRQTLMAGVRMLAADIPFLLVLGLLIGFGIKRPLLIPVAPGPFLGAIAVIAWHVGNFDSLLSLFLSPTGIPFTFDYLNFIGGTRNLVLRRS
jgi:hypothetical protein